ncbi:endonuclease Q family protein [Bacillus sp. FJAT-47783]|uniref:endonuclease Q family protein n=1 Tax=Bacillus sp. FJAT-47783 TaxID=2922712 RepID=UPI001FAE0EEE|nr:endonuclease Q family protein [Bacillus sp. FJAT-47783]
MNTFFVDLHIHIGRTPTGKPVKITGSRTLTMENILYEAVHYKGIDIIGVIDCHVPEVLDHLEEDLQSGRYSELQDGGIRFENTTLLLGSELEIYDENCHGPIHVLVFLPTIHKMRTFSLWCQKYVKNIHLSSQRLYVTGTTLQKKVKELNGLFIPAHIFTPFKSLYGKGVRFSLTEVFLPELIDGVELGLSADTEMASYIAELKRYPFLTNSDAHSLTNIAREYQQMLLKTPSFQEVKYALKGINGRKVVANYGLNPKLGKYYLTFCNTCEKMINHKENSTCPYCGSTSIVKGVLNRICELSTHADVYDERPPYMYQIPLAFIPGIGKKTLAKLLDRFGTEMNVMHRVSFEELTKIVPEKIATFIVAAREGGLHIEAGGGGVYGKVTRHKDEL